MTCGHDEASLVWVAGLGYVAEPMTDETAAGASPLPEADGDAVGLVKALGFVAWSDETIAPEEREMLSHVLDALAIPEGRRTELCQAFREGPPTIDEIKAAFTDDVERRFALAQAVMMAQADGAIAPSERRDIAALAEALGVPSEELQMIYAAVDLTGNLAAELSEPPPASTDG